MNITKRKRKMPVKREKAVSAKRKRTVPAKRKRMVPTGDGVLENPDRKWRLVIGPMETAFAAENAPLCQMVIQNQGLSVIEVRAGEMEEAVVLMPGKLSVMLAYGRIIIENVEEKLAIVEMEFSPRAKF
jgi:hypothetical protein